MTFGILTRRVDDLGRIQIPKVFREQADIKESDMLTIELHSDNTFSLYKATELSTWEEVAHKYANVLQTFLSNFSILICTATEVIVSKGEEMFYPHTPLIQDFIELVASNKGKPIDGLHGGHIVGSKYCYFRSIFPIVFESDETIIRGSVTILGEDLPNIYESDAIYSIVELMSIELAEKLDS